MTSDRRLGATNVGFRRNGLDLKSGGQASHSKMSVAEMSCHWKCADCRHPINMGTWEL
jgi:hypothetical protein